MIDNIYTEVNRINQARFSLGYGPMEYGISEQLDRLIVRYNMIVNECEKEAGCESFAILDNSKPYTLYSVEKAAGKLDKFFKNNPAVFYKAFEVARMLGCGDVYSAYIRSLDCENKSYYEDFDEIDNLTKKLEKTGRYVVAACRAFIDSIVLPEGYVSLLIVDLDEEDETKDYKEWITSKERACEILREYLGAAA